MQKEVSVAEAWSRKYPEQVVLAVTRNQEGRINLMAVGWMAIVSDEPPMFMLGIDDHAYTLELIRENREFVVAYPAVSMTQATLYAGTVHGHKEDKGARSGLTFIPAAKVGVPLRMPVGGHPPSRQLPAGDRRNCRHPRQQRPRRQTPVYSRFKLPPRRGLSRSIFIPQSMRSSPPSGSREGRG